MGSGLRGFSVLRVWVLGLFGFFVCCGFFLLFCLGFLVDAGGCVMNPRGKLTPSGIISLLSVMQINFYA